MGTTTTTTQNFRVDEQLKVEESELQRLTDLFHPQPIYIDLSTEASRKAFLEDEADV